MGNFCQQVLKLLGSSMRVFTVTLLIPYAGFTFPTQVAPSFPLETKPFFSYHAKDENICKSLIAVSVTFSF